MRCNHNHKLVFLPNENKISESFSKAEQSENDPVHHPFHLGKNNKENNLGFSNLCVYIGDTRFPNPKCSTRSHCDRTWALLYNLHLYTKTKLYQYIGNTRN